MTDDAKSEARSIIWQRWESARDNTDEIAAKMDKWEKQYEGEFQEAQEEDERVFLPKTKEQIQAVHAHLVGIVSQLHPMVTMMPMVSTLSASNDEYKRAKVAEALVNFHMEDLWNFKEDILPKFIKTFLKFTLGVVKISYIEDNFLPDLKIEVKDRALLFIDPYAHDIRDAKWVVEKYYISRSEALERIHEGHWYLPEDRTNKLEQGFLVNETAVNHDVLKRLYGDNLGDKTTSVPEDDLVEIWDYWQAPTKGLDDVYAVVLGGEDGELVRYGRNPYPYKGIPYRAKSFDSHEHQLDGTGMVEQFRPFQEILNNFLNLRLTDVRKNIIRPVAFTGRFIDAQTQQDFKDGQKMVRLSDEVMEASKDPAFDLRKHMVELPIGTSTLELLSHDWPIISGQAKEASHVSDVFRGQAPPHQATLGQVQEQINQNQGVFKPVIMQVMRLIEEVAEVCMEYFKDPEFYPTERLIQIVGKNRYSDVIDNWHQVGPDLQVRSVTPDDMDVDVIVNAVNGAEAIASRTLMLQAFEGIFQAIGQIPDLYAELKEDLSFNRVTELMLNNTGQDVDYLRMTPEEKQQRAQAQQQAQQEAQQQELQMQQQQMQIQVQLQQQLEQIKAQAEIQAEQGKQQAKAQAQMQVEATKSQWNSVENEERITLEREKEMDLIVAKVMEQLQADIIRMQTEAKLEEQTDANIGHGNEIGRNQSHQ